MKLIRTVPFTLFVLGACQSSGTTPSRPTALNEALLVEVSAADQSRVADARDARNLAKDANAAAQADYLRIRGGQTSADQDSQAASLASANAEAALVKAVEKGTTDEVAIARHNVQSAKTVQAVREATVVLRSKQTSSAAAVADVAEQHLKVAEARVELAKVTAVNTLDRPDMQKPDAAIFEASVRHAEAGESVARAKSDAAFREVEVAAQSLKACQDSDTR